MMYWIYVNGSYGYAHVHLAQINCMQHKKDEGEPHPSSTDNVELECYVIAKLSVT